MAGQGTMRWLDTLIDEHRVKGYERIDIYMSRTKRAELLREIMQSTLILPNTPKKFGQQVEQYKGCQINLAFNLASDDSEPSVYIVAWGKEL